LATEQGDGKRRIQTFVIGVMIGVMIGVRLGILAFIIGPYEFDSYDKCQNAKPDPIYDPIYSVTYI